MANIIQIKRNSTTNTNAPTTSNITYGELGYNNNNGAGGKLYIGGKASNGSAQVEDITANILAGVSIATAHASAPTVGKSGFLSANFAVNGSGYVSIAANGIDSDNYTDGSIDVAHMSANSIDSAQYVDGSIDLAHMSANSIDSTQYVDGSIDLAHMSANSIDSAQYVDGSIDTAHYAAGSVDATALATNSVDSAELINGSIDTGHFSTGCVDAAAMGANSVDSSELVNGSIDEGHIADNAVTANKIVDNITLAGNCGTTGNFVVGNNLTVTGTTTTVNSTTVTLDDVVLTLGGDTAPTSDPAIDYGIEWRYWTETDAQPSSGEAVIGFAGYDDSLERYVILTEASVSSGAYSGDRADIDIAKIYGERLDLAYGSGGNGTIHNVTIDCGTF